VHVACSLNQNPLLQCPDPSNASNSEPELGWLSEATTFADAYLARLQDASDSDPLAGLPGAGNAAAQAALYQAFRRVFPAMDVARLDADDPMG